MKHASETTTRDRWERAKRHLQARWTLLTDADLDIVNGNVERLIDLLQQRYGYGRQRAQTEILLWRESLV